MTREEIAQYIKSELANEDVEIYLDADDYRIIVEALEQESILDKIRAEINKNIEQEDFARSVFINKEKDYRKANQCTGNLQAYEKVLDMIDNLLKENEDV